MLRTWWAAPSTADGAADRRLLSPAELRRRDRLRQQADRDRFTTAWSLARRTLAELTGVAPAELEFVRSCEHCGHPAHGRPRLAAGGLSFNLSHSGDRVLLAVCDTGQVGVDVEATGRDITRLARRVLHPADPRPAAGDLLRIWVRKEAIVKASGHGLALPMSGIELARPANGATVLDIDADDGYVAAVATIESTPRRPRISTVEVDRSHVRSI